MDSINLHNQHDTALYLTAKEAAEKLGIAVTSLYAYVGRKGIRSVAQPGSRKRLYWREDVERISQPKSTPPLLRSESLLVPETQITLLTDEGPFYRGHSAVTLAETATLEDVAAILWDQPKDAVFPAEPPKVPADLSVARAGLSNLSPRDQAASLFALIERSHPRNYDRSALGFARAGGELVRWFAAFATDKEVPDTTPIHITLARGWNAPPEFDDILRRTLVLLADHELTADTYAVRALANTGCTPHQAVVTGMIATNGHWIRQGRVAAVRRLIDEIISDHDPSRLLVNLCKEGDLIPGFQGRTDAGCDARTIALLNALEGQLGDSPEVRKVLKAINIAREDIAVEPSFTLVILLLERLLKLSPHDGSLKVASRMVGWIAHAYEQMQTGHVVRMHSAYTGPLPGSPNLADTPPDSIG